MMFRTAIVASAVGVGITLSACGPTVGGTPVPHDLHCEEDQVIGFHGVPDDLVCLNIEDVRR